MTRELSSKAGAALLRKAFHSKGANISHTEALDLLAKLKGYEAWSHMQQAVTPAKSRSHHEHGVSLQDTLIQQYGAEGELPLLPRSRLASTRSASYWGWVVDVVVGNGLWQGPNCFEPSGPVAVTYPDGSAGKWHIEQNLTDRWGELNDHAVERKPGLALLTLDAGLFERLRTQMWDEITFIVRKDGELGLLFEVEYASIESERGHEEDAANHYRPHAEMVAHLVGKLRALQSIYSQVEFCVPDCAEIVNDRPAVWAFYKLDTLDIRAREALGRALLTL